MINPLQQQQIKKLNKQGNDDLARKVSEIIDFLNETMPQKRSQEKKKTDMVPDDQSEIKNACSHCHELQDAILEDIVDSILIMNRQKSYQNEFDKLERRYRNDEICFWIILIAVSSIVGLWVGLLLRMFL